MNLFSNPLLSTASLKRAALDGLPDADELSLTEVENWTPLSVGVSRAHDEKKVYADSEMGPRPAPQPVAALEALALGHALAGPSALSDTITNFTAGL